MGRQTSDFFPNLRFPLFLLLATAAALFLTACPFELADLEEPQVLNMTISPSAITLAETGAANKFFDVEISVANFDDQPDFASVFIQNGNRTATYSNIHFEGNLILIQGISYTWFQGYTPGVYPIGVEIESPTTSLTELNQATVTINP